MEEYEEDDEEVEDPTLEESFTEEQIVFISKLTKKAKILTLCELLLMFVTLSCCIAFACLEQVAFLIVGIVSTVVMIGLFVFFAVIMTKLNKFVSSISKETEIQDNDKK